MIALLKGIFLQELFPAVYFQKIMKYHLIGEKVLS